MKHSTTILCFGLIAALIALSVGLEYDAPCTIENDECDKGQFLECGTETKCSCKDNAFRETDKCVLKLEQTCVAEPKPEDQMCSSDAECLGDGPKCSCKTEDGMIPNIDMNKCVKPWFEQACNTTFECDGDLNLDCKEEKCDCKDENHIVNDEKTFCQPSHGETCDEATDANKCTLSVPNLECKNTTCECEDHKKWNSTSCNSLADQPCVVNLPDCYDNLHCMEGKCMCNGGLEANKEGVCFATYDAPCKTPDDDEALTCNKDVFLRCKNEKCDCLDNYVHDHEKNKCTIAAGGDCMEDETTGMCHSSSKCEKEEEGEKFICKCGDGLVIKDQVCNENNGVGKISLSVITLIVSVFAYFYF